MTKLHNSIQLNSTQQTTYKKGIWKSLNGYRRGLHSISSAYPAFLHELQMTGIKRLKNFVAYGHVVIQYSVGKLLRSMLKFYAW